MTHGIDVGSVWHRIRHHGRTTHGPAAAPTHLGSAARLGRSDERRRLLVGRVLHEAAEARPPGAAARQLEQPVGEEPGVARQRRRRSAVLLLAQDDVVRSCRRGCSRPSAEQRRVHGAGRRRQRCRPACPGRRPRAASRRRAPTTKSAAASRPTPSTGPSGTMTPRQARGPATRRRWSWSRATTTSVRLRRPARPASSSKRPASSAGRRRLVARRRLCAARRPHHADDVPALDAEAGQRGRVRLRVVEVVLLLEAGVAEELVPGGARAR